MGEWRYTSRVEMAREVNEILAKEENHKKFTHHEIHLVGDDNETMYLRRHGSCMNMPFHDVVVVYALVKALENNGLNVGEVLSNELDKVELWEIDF